MVDKRWFPRFGWAVSLRRGRGGAWSNNLSWLAQSVFPSAFSLLMCCGVWRCLGSWLRTCARFLPLSMPTATSGSSFPGARMFWLRPSSRL